MIADATPQPAAARPAQPAAADFGLTVRDLTGSERAAWDTGLRSSPQHHPFLESTWLETVARCDELAIERLGVFDGERLVAGCLGQVEPRRNPTRWRGIELSSCTGIWIASGDVKLPHRAARRERRILRAIAEHLSTRYVEARIETHPANVDVRPLLWAGWQAQLRYTFLSDLAGNHVERFDPDVRRRAQRARELGLRFDPDLSPADFVPLWAETLRRRGVALPTEPGRMVAMLDALKQAGFARIHGVSGAERLTAGNVVLVAGERAAYWLAGYDANADASLCANQYCAVRTLESISQKARWFDWVGANLEPIADYKQSLGPTLTPYYRLTHRRPAAAEPRRGWLSRWIRPSKDRP